MDAENFSIQHDKVSGSPVPEISYNKRWKRYHKSVIRRKRLNEMSLQLDNETTSNILSTSGETTSNILISTTASLTQIPVIPLQNHIGLGLTEITVVRSENDLNDAIQMMRLQDAVGFDTESRPTFKKGEISCGPHLIQIATPTRAFLFSIPNNVSRNTAFDTSVQTQLNNIIMSDKIKKIGFDFKSDKAELYRKFGVTLKNEVDLSLLLRAAGEKDLVGTKRGALQVLGTHFQKNKSISRSNWGKPIDTYSVQMLLYAANDAHVALLVYNEWLRKKNLCT